MLLEFAWCLTFLTVVRVRKESLLHAESLADRVLHERTQRMAAHRIR